MSFWGKLIGGFLGFSMAGPFGALIGVWIGNSFDRGLSSFSSGFRPSFTNANPHETQNAFFHATFAVMGHIAKADGIVSKQEIQAAETVMTQLGLDSERRQQAIEAFNIGKQADFDLTSNLESLVQHCFRQPSLIQMFLEIQILAATADGEVKAEEREILYLIGGLFRLPRSQMDRLIEMVRAQQSFHQGGSTSSRNQSVPTLGQAYKVLGINQDASKAQVKRAYRKLMSQHHPDKLVAKGMPQEMVKVATEKSQEIQAAYEMIKRASF
ncbi:MAG: co-chaperone DjlA [Enterobacterales bacterium]|nr:co-chaperone DjlA [Enterobacterales bacterium]